MVYCRTVFKYNGLAAACRRFESAVPAARVHCTNLHTGATILLHTIRQGSIRAVDDDSCRRLDHAELEVGDVKRSLSHQQGHQRLRDLRGGEELGQHDRARAFVQTAQQI